jgi:hypothetical protein
VARYYLPARLPQKSYLAINHVCYVAFLPFAVALARNDPSRALALLEVSAPYELGWGLYTAYLRGQAYLAEHRGAEERLLSSRKSSTTGGL